MKFQLFNYAPQPGVVRHGVTLESQWFDLGPGAWDALLQDWSTAERELTVQLGSKTGLARPLNPDMLVLLPAVANPGVIYAAGANYRDHVIAMGKAFNMKLTLDPKADGIAPWHFIKAGRGTLVGSGAEVPFPPHTQKLDWEAELAVVIGKVARHVSAEEALSYVAGYTVTNDVSARDNLTRQGVDLSSPFRFDWIGHKCFEGSCPIGPVFTPATFIETPESLGIKLWVNGELKQDSNTSNHMYSVAEQISYLSNRLTLYPGDLLLTGTPAGVGMESGTFLKQGDSVSVWIEELGELHTTFV